jgi:hypothetical protein
LPSSLRHRPPDFGVIPLISGFAAFNPLLDAL